MSDKQKTCGGCAWWGIGRLHEHKDGCNAPYSFSCDPFMYADLNSQIDASYCHMFRSHADAALIAECYRKRSLGIAIPWSDVDRLVELLAGKPLERRKRCFVCYGSGVVTNREPWTAITASDMATCGTCHGTGYQGGER